MPENRNQNEQNVKQGIETGGQFAEKTGASVKSSLKKFAGLKARTPETSGFSPDGKGKQMLSLVSASSKPAAAALGIMALLVIVSMILTNIIHSDSFLRYGLAEKKPGSGIPTGEQAVFDAIVQDVTESPLGDDFQNAAEDGERSAEEYLTDGCEGKCEALDGAYATDLSEVKIHIWINSHERIYELNDYPEVTVGPDDSGESGTFTDYETWPGIHEVTEGVYELAEQEFMKKTAAYGLAVENAIESVESAENLGLDEASDETDLFHANEQNEAGEEFLRLLREYADFYLREAESWNLESAGNRKYTAYRLDETEETAYPGIEAVDENGEVFVQPDYDNPVVTHASRLIEEEREVTVYTGDVYVYIRTYPFGYKSDIVPQIAEDLSKASETWSYHFDSALTAKAIDQKIAMTYFIYTGGVIDMTYDSFDEETPGGYSHDNPGTPIGLPIGWEGSTGGIVDSNGVTIDFNSKYYTFSPAGNVCICDVKNNIAWPYGNCVSRSSTGGFNKLICSSYAAGRYWEINGHERSFLEVLPKNWNQLLYDGIAPGRGIFTNDSADMDRPILHSIIEMGHGRNGSHVGFIEGVIYNKEGICTSVTISESNVGPQPGNDFGWRCVTYTGSSGSECIAKWLSGVYADGQGYFRSMYGPED